MGALIPYFGGKNRLLKQIIARITPHTCYVEVFAGGAGVLFKKDQSQVEVLNDLDRELITFYRVIKHHPEEFYRQFKYIFFARDEFQRLQKVVPETLTDVQRAARYFYLQRSAFGGKVIGQTFGVCATRPPRVNILNMQELIHSAWERLASVVIECLDFRQLIPRYDRPETFFFLDPPYWQIPGYHHNFAAQDFMDLAATLSGVKGHFLMTINDTPEVREIFGRFKIDEVKLRYSMSGNSNARGKEHTELLATNY